MDIFTGVSRTDQAEKELRVNRDASPGYGAMVLSLSEQLKREKEKNKRLSVYRSNARKHARQLQRAYNDLRRACLEYDLKSSLDQSHHAIWFYASTILLNAVGLIIGLLYGRF